MRFTGEDAKRLILEDAAGEQRARAVDEALAIVGMTWERLAFDARRAVGMAGVDGDSERARNLLRLWMAGALYGMAASRLAEAERELGER